MKITHVNRNGNDPSGALCYVCDKQLTYSEYASAHMIDGRDVHEACCPRCEPAGWVLVKSGSFTRYLHPTEDAALEQIANSGLDLTGFVATPVYWGEQ